MTSNRWRVKLETPASTQYLHIVRLTAAGAAAEAGLDTEEHGSPGYSADMTVNA